MDPASESQTPVTKPVPARRQSSVDDQTLKKLEDHLRDRPDKNKLVEEGILKSGNVAPAIQAARDELQRSQLQDKLGQALQNRPKPEELVKEGILQRMQRFIIIFHDPDIHVTHNL
ncbi:hypothetical protein BD410DRAFT_767385 [Rickenella mellea]|uniref:RPEL repeat protein n=1 Tax=Rickenella mellea TaxID=50990 RepID=A0A4Y7Q970_9AGAM|nr:hypothetical protein BD410DRAFT_767385 [Rickenella mellea]